jgi:hypothetical protein
MTITVVNKHRHDSTKQDIYIGRPGVFGNPFPINNVENRDMVIRRYRNHLWLVLQKEDPTNPLCIAFDNLVERAKTEHINLVCYCAPHPCHGDVLKAAIKWRLAENPVQEQNY